MNEEEQIDQQQHQDQNDSSLNSKIVTKYLSDLISIRLDSPIQINFSKVSCKIFNCNQMFYIQTPKMAYKCQPGNKIKLFFENSKTKQNKSDSNLEEFYIFFKEIEKQLREQSDNIVSQILLLDDGVPKDDNDNSSSTKTSQDLFYSSIETPDALQNGMSFVCDVDYTTFEVYDRKGNKFTEMNEFFKYKQGTFIILCECVFITPSRSSIQWKVIQGLVHPDKKVNVKSKQSTSSSEKPKKVNKFHIKKEEDRKIYKTNTPTIKFSVPEEINVKLD